MEFVKYVYQPEAEMRFTRADVDYLTACARRHYDSVCRSSAEVGGLIFGLRNRLGADEAATRSFNSRELDLLLKVCESSFKVCESSFEEHQLHRSLRWAHERLDRAWRNLNLEGVMP